MTEHAVAAGEVPLYRQPLWERAHPWLEQGITGRGPTESFDLGLFGETSTGVSARRWRALREATGFPRAVHARQVHGSLVLRHDGGVGGLFIADDADGHATNAPRVLLTVSVADCVPIMLIAPEARVVALLHAGWRGAAAGVLEAGVELLARAFDSAPESLEAHLGPAICGACFEVGPEVPHALGLDLPRAGRVRVDLRAALAERARQRGLRPAAITVSTHCTRCGGSDFFSHRAGARERQMAILGVRERRR